MISIGNFFDTTIEKISSNKYEPLNSDWLWEPPLWKDYLSSGDYITPVELSDKQMESSLAILGDNPKKIFSPERVVSLGVFVVGKGGGKDWLIALIQCYVVTVLLHLKNPQRFLEIDGNLDLLTVGIKGLQGEKVFFDYFKERIKDNKWIIDNFKIVEENRIFSKPKLIDRGSIYLTNKSAEFPNKIRCFSETSKNESWEGYNVIFFVLDEISGFMTEKQTSNGWKIFETANSSCISRRTKNYKGLGFIISYPRQEKNDIILDLYELSKTKDYIYGMRCFAWHFKLASKYSGQKFEFHNQRINRAFGIPEEQRKGILIPIEYFEDFDRKPEESLTKYCALPPRATGDWIEYPDRVISAIDYSATPMFFTEDYTITKVNPETGEENSFLAKKIISCNEPSNDVRRNFRYVAWLDNAEVACDASICIGRKETIELLNEHQIPYSMEICRIVDVINWTPEPGLPIDLENVEDFLVKIIPKYLNLREVGKDRWESATLHNKLTKKGIKSIRYNLSGEHYNIGKYFFYIGAVRIHDEEKWTNKHKKELTSLEQMLALINSPKGPIKKEGLKKDKSDSVIGVINILMGDEWTKKQRPQAQKTNLLGTPKLGMNSPYKQGEYFIANPSMNYNVTKVNSNEDTSVIKKRPANPVKA